MPQDRKPGEPSAPAAIPRPRDGDVEDVSWALSTAEAMWGRGDRADALKWVRRAAEAASEAEEDDRALEIAKAAADLAQAIERGGSMPPPTLAQSAGPTTLGSAAARNSAPKINRNVMVQPVSPAAQGQAPRALVTSGEAPRPPAAVRPSSPGAPQASRGSHSEIARRPRKSAHAIEEPAPKTTADPRRSSQAGASKRQPSVTNEAPRRRRSTIPPPAREDRTETTNVSLPKPPSAAPPSGHGTEPHTTDEMEQWPTQARGGEALSEMADEMTRVGGPAFVDGDGSPSGRPPPSVRAPSPSQAPGARPSQAVRVVVWRSADGVHVAPHGTTVSAITVDAMLVALDPSADLASWLAKK